MPQPAQANALDLGVRGGSGSLSRPHCMPGQRRMGRLWHHPIAARVLRVLHVTRHILIEWVDVAASVVGGGVGNVEERDVRLVGVTSHPGEMDVLLDAPGGAVRPEHVYCEAEQHLASCATASDPW